MFFDSHAHYNDEKFYLDREEIIGEVYAEGIKTIVNAGYSLESSKEACNLAKQYNFIYATVGVSPNDIEKLDNNYLDKIILLAQQPKVVAIGEIGLDYYWNKENKERQKKIFIQQIELANNLNLPIVIHTREAIFDTIDILKKQIVCNKKGVFHCCPFNVDLVKEALKLGYYISFAGPVTFKNSKNAKEIVEMVPLDKMLIETDSPYLAPEPVRGTRNNSINVKYIAKKIAEFKNKEIEEIANITAQNAKRIFEIE